MAAWESIFSFNNRDTIFTCSNCKKETVVHNQADLHIIACESCHKIHSKHFFEKYLRLHNTFKQDKYSLKLNQSGTYQDEEFRIVGIANKQEQHNAYSKWTEHVLLSKSGQVSFLNECYGHYTWMKEKSDIPTDNINEFIKSGIKYDGRTYYFLNRYKYKTQNCVGAFNYDLIDVSDINCYDFVSPPYAISIEVHDKNRREAFHGFNITSKKVAAAFNNPDIVWKTKEGVGMAQPFYFGININTFKRSMYIFIAFIAALTIGILSVEKGEQSLFSASFEGEALTSGKEFVTQSFALNPSETPYYLKFDGYAGVSNEWVDMALTLVNETTGEEREFGLTIEKYSGVSNGYSWEEGSTTEKVNLSGVQPGKYHIKCKLFTSCVNPTSVDLSCHTGSTVVWNSLLIIVILTVLTFLLTRIHNQFERVRRGEIDNLMGS